METTSMGIWIPTEIWKNKNLTVTEKLFIVKISALDGEKGCYASNRYFSEFFNLSKSRCSAVIKNLKDKGYIAIHYAYEEGKKAIERRVIKVEKAVYNIMKKTKEAIKKSGENKEFLDDESEEIENKIECLELSEAKTRKIRKRIREENQVDIDEVEEELGIDNIEDDPRKLDINEAEEEDKQLDICEEGKNIENIKSNSGNNKLKANNNIRNINNKSNNKIIYEEIINYLNLKCNKNFKHTTGKTVRSINARIREGYNLDDFKTVIDKKYDEWANTTMKVYLRPETLFGTKFERYLNEDVKDRENHFKKSNWTGGQAHGKQFKNVRNSGENKETEERTRFGNINPLTAEEIERAKRELF